MAQFSGSLDEGRITFDTNKDISLAQTKAKDVVCGAMIDLRDALTASYAGHSYYFCGVDCQMMFEADPTKYSDQ
jgi:YHS domain-containing protein